MEISKPISLHSVRVPKHKRENNGMQVKYICDKCGEGEMYFCGIYSIENGIGKDYLHVCSQCQQRASLKTSYPQIRDEYGRKV